MGVILPSAAFVRCPKRLGCRSLSSKLFSLTSHLILAQFLSLQWMISHRPPTRLVPQRTTLFSLLFPCLINASADTAAMLKFREGEWKVCYFSPTYSLSLSIFSLLLWLFALWRGATQHRRERRLGGSRQFGAVSPTADALIETFFYRSLIIRLIEPTQSRHKRLGQIYGPLVSLHRQLVAILSLLSLSNLFGLCHVEHTIDLAEEGSQRGKRWAFKNLPIRQ